MLLKTPRMLRKIDDIYLKIKGDIYRTRLEAISLTSLCHYDVQLDRQPNRSLLKFKIKINFEDN